VPLWADPVGHGWNAVDDVKRNLKESDDMNYGDRSDIDNYNQRIRQAKAADPTNWRENWTRQNGGPPIEPAPRPRVDY